jgi:hypothetical protein
VAVDAIGDSAFEGSYGVFGCFALGDLAVVVGPALAVVAELADRCDVDGVVEFAVVSWVEAMAGPPTRGGIDRGGGVTSALGR